MFLFFIPIDTFLNLFTDGLSDCPFFIAPLTASLIVSFLFMTPFTSSSFPFFSPSPSSSSSLSFPHFLFFPSSLHFFIPSPPFLTLFPYIFSIHLFLHPYTSFLYILSSIPTPLSFTFLSYIFSFAPIPPFLTSFPSSLHLLSLYPSHPFFPPLPHPYNFLILYPSHFFLSTILSPPLPPTLFPAIITVPMLLSPTKCPYSHDCINDEIKKKRLITLIYIIICIIQYRHVFCGSQMCVGSEGGKG